jgi:FMN phosphatase YigB (HAD superfamily)
MPKIKLVSWDVYGTLIVTGNNETSDVEELEYLKARSGALEALSEINSRKITQITSSDGDLENLKDNLKEVGINWRDFFDDLYKMIPWRPKDFSEIIKNYQIKPENLLVIGDSYTLDIAHAKKQGCQTLWVPESSKYKNNYLDIQKIKDFLDLE